MALPTLCTAALGVELRGDARYEWAVLLCWTVPAYVVCEIVSTWWLIRMAGRLQPPDKGPGARSALAAARPHPHH